jgi:hypothetical protein
LVILWTRDKRETRDFRAHSEMFYYMRVRSLRGRINGVEGLEGGELEGEIRGVEVGREGGDRNRGVMNSLTHLFLSPRGPL